MAAIPPSDRPVSLPSVPTPLTPLIGREREIDALCDLLRQPESRLVTLIGPGGIGKTRLALATAERLRDEWRDGSVFVPLQSVSEQRFVASAIAQSLGVRESGGVPLLDSISAALRARQLLLVLDNFEHVLAAAPLITDLLTACPSVNVLVTSRAMLHLYGERDYVVPPLALPDLDHLPALPQLAEAEAMRLFVERAQAVRPTFALTADNGPVVAQICARVDCLPLAIELAAARVRMLSPAALLARLERRLTVLRGGPLDVPARQQTMQDTIAWSYDLLTPDEQSVLRQLSVFAGGWTLDAAEAVCHTDGDALDGLTTLVDHSLVHQREQPDGSMRFGALQTIREFGHGRLEEVGALHDTSRRHVAYFLALAEQTEPDQMQGLQHTLWLNTLEAEHDNLRGALAWAVEHDAESALRLAGALGNMWFLRGHLSEGRRWLETALARGDAASAAARAKGYRWAGDLATWQLDLEQGNMLLTEAMRLYQELKDREGIAWTLFRFAGNAQGRRDYPRATRLYGESLAIHRETGNAFGIVMSLGNMGATALYHGNEERSAMLLNEALTLGRESRTATVWLRLLGYLAITQEDYPRARALVAEALALSRDLNLPRSSCEAIEGFALIATFDRMSERAVRLFGAAHSVRERIGHPMYSDERVRCEQALDSIHSTLGDEAFSAAWESGRAMSLDDAIAFALETSSSASVALSEAAPCHALSPRELQVVRGLVAGQSNAEIASALFISPNTVANHVANIMNKLGLDSRTAVATWAVRNGVD